MHTSKDGAGPHHEHVTSSSSQSRRHPTPSTSYVSTLSHALNISTPTSVKQAVQPSHTSTAQSMPTRPTYVVSGSHQATPTKTEALRTPTRSEDPLRILNLSGHQAFQSPGTPISPWSAAPFSETVGTAANQILAASVRIDQPPLPQAKDKEWFMSEPASIRASNIFDALPTATPVVPHPHHDARGSAGVRALKSGTVSNHRMDANSTATPQGPFQAYREQPTSDPRVSIYEASAVSEVPTNQSAISPTLVASLSPVQASSAFPFTLSDGTFLSEIFEQDTPSLSTHHLPSHDLTQELPQRAKHTLGEVQALGTARSFTFIPPAIHHNDTAQRRPQSTCHPPSGGAQHSSTSSEMASSTAIIEMSSAAMADPPRAVFLHPPSSKSANHEHTLVVGEHSPRQARFDSTGNARQSKPKLNSRCSEEPFNIAAVEDERFAGLGLDLNAAAGNGPGHVELVASSSENSYASAGLVDEMGRWMIGSEGPRLTHSDQSSLSATESMERHDRWHAQESSTASLGATTEASFTSYSNSSTWDSSFNDDPRAACGPPSSSVDSHFVATPASSLGPSHTPHWHPGKPSDCLTGPHQQRSPLATPEVAMNDFSEFVQSVSIEQMAEERWRTWPLNRDSAIVDDRASTSALPTSPGAAAQLQVAERNSFDSLSVSASSGRSRLMAEPYNKNVRSGRPSSSASTSSRSSMGNAVTLEGQQSSGVTGPTRPRSYIATGSLRMSSATRSGSGGAGSDTGQVGERLSGTALALRRARGMSQGGHVTSNTSGSAMKLTRSSDALIAPGSSTSSAAKFRHSVALQRTALSSEGLSQAAQRPQSLLETTSHSESLRKLGSTTAKPKLKVGLNEVSVALDTLRLFFQREAADKDSVTVPSPTERTETGSPDKPSRTLRRTKGVLPPKGAFGAVDEFGTLQTSASASLLPALYSSPQSPVHPGRSQSLGTSFLDPRRNVAASRREDGLAVLEDVSERVLRLQAETERQTAASMPPPAARPASMHHRGPVSMTRRERHDEYLRKRATGS